MLTKLFSQLKKKILFLFFINYLKNFNFSFSPLKSLNTKISKNLLFYFKVKTNFFVYKVIDLKKKLCKILLSNKINFKQYFIYLEKFNRNFFKYVKFSKNWNKIVLILFDFVKIQNILIFSRFLTSFQDVNFFIKNSFIFKNRLPVSNKFIYCKKLDFIELLVFKDFYLYNLKCCKFILNYRLDKLLKTKKSVSEYSLNNLKIFKLSKFIKNCFELDFFSMTCVFLKWNFFSLNIKIKMFFLGYNFKYYGWKKLI